MENVKYFLIDIDPIILWLGPILILTPFLVYWNKPFKKKLKMKSIFQNCQKKLTLDISDVMICYYECTYCRTCAIEVLNNSCPNCGGCFEKRPARVSQ